MTATEVARLFDWLQSKGFTADQASECIHFIAYGNKPKDEKQKTE